MGCNHSRSEDLRQRSSLLHSNAFMESLEDVPGYFNQTLSPTDYLSSTLPTAHMNKPEMSFHGPPSHLQNSVDVHPFWFEFGRDFHPKERFIDRSRSMDSIPAGLLPGTNTAQEYRNIEIRETMQNLRQQVKDVMSERIDEADGEEVITSSSPSTDIDNTMTMEEKSTMDFFESMLQETLDNDADEGDTGLGKGGGQGGGSQSTSDDSNLPKTAILDVLPSTSDDEWSRSRQEPSLTSLLPNNLDRPVVGRVHSIVSDDQRSPKKGSPKRSVPFHHVQQAKLASIPNGHSGFLKNNVYLPKESSISSLHRNPHASPSRKAPPPPTKPKPKRGSGNNNTENKRYSYPMGGSSQPTEFGANFLMGNRPVGRNYSIPNGHHVHNSPNSSTVSEDTGIGSDFRNDQNSPVKHVVYNRFMEYPNQNQNGHSQHDERTPYKSFRHSAYGENNNAMPYGYNVANGNKNNSNVVAVHVGALGKRRLSDDVVSNDSAVVKDAATDDVVLHGIESDLMQLQLTS